MTQPSILATAAEIGARLDRLPATRYIWKLVLLLSLGGCFEIYDLFFTAYIGPGRVRSGLFSSSSASFFGFNGLARLAGTCLRRNPVSSQRTRFADDKSRPVRSAKEIGLGKLREGIRLEHCIESSNTFNHPQFCGPDTTYIDLSLGIQRQDSNFGKLFHISNALRHLQMALKLYF